LQVNYTRLIAIILESAGNDDNTTKEQEEVTRHLGRVGLQRVLKKIEQRCIRRNDK
jgi:hypothetical protein